MWCPITYFEFYDVPRLFVVEWQERFIVFDCPFDEDLDDYPAQYTVYSALKRPQVRIDRAWIRDLPIRNRPDGQVPVGSIIFDESRRKTMRDDVLWMLYGG